MGRPVDPREWYRIERVRTSKFVLPSRLRSGSYSFKVSSVENDEETMSEAQVKEILTPIVMKQDKSAVEDQNRRNELVQRIIDRCFNYPAIYANRETGEVTT